MAAQPLRDAQSLRDHAGPRQADVALVGAGTARVEGYGPANCAESTSSVDNMLLIGGLWRIRYLL